MAELLAAGTASAVSIHVPNPHKDVCDFLRAGGSVAEILAISEGVDTQPPKSASNAEVEVPYPRSHSQIQKWRPFPVEALPSPVREFVVETAAAQGSDPALIALPALATLASAIGNSKVIVLKQGWSEPCVLWTATVAESGTLKSPAYDAAVRPLRARQSDALRRHREAEKEYADCKARYDVEYAEWKRNKGNGDIPQAPEKLHAERLVVEDTTVEALCERLAHAPRGLLLAREELAGWFGSFDQYRQGRGGDEARWLSIHRAGSVTVDRKSGNQSVIHVDRAAVSIAGTIQPAVLSNLLGKERFESGLAARFLFAHPPRKAKRWSDRTVPESVTQAYDSLVGDLLKLELAEDINGLAIPALVHLSPESRKEWIEFYERNADITFRSSGAEAAMHSKIEGVAARFALVIYVMKSVTTDDYSFSLQIDVESMRSAVVLAEWFAYEAKRIYALFYESSEERAQRELLEWLKRQEGRITAALLARQGLRCFRGKKKAAKATLDALVAEGRGEWRDVPAGPRGGRRTTEFVLLELAVSERGYVDMEPQPPESASNRGVAYPGASESGKTVTP